MITKGAIVLCLLFVSATAIADEQLGFKGNVIGSKLSDLVDQERYMCAQPPNQLADITCSLKYGIKETIAEANVTSLSLNYYDNILSEIDMNISSSNFQSVVAALTDKYGQPSKRTEQLKNGYGAEFTNEIAIWSQADSKLIAEHFHSDVNTSRITFRSNSYFQEFMKRLKTATQSKAKDL